VTPLDVAITGAQVVTGGEARAATVGIRDGRVALLADPAVSVPAREVIEAAGLVVLPGLVDAHVHMREPGFVHKEGFATGSMAAAAGGVTTMMVMPTTEPPTLTAQDFENKVRLAEGAAYVDFALLAGVSADCSQLETLVKLGAASFELFFGDMPPPLLVTDNGRLREILRHVARLGGVAGVTPTEQDIVRVETARLEAEGRREPRAFAGSRPPIAEALGVARACLLAEETGARVHLRQVSCALSLDILRATRGRYPRLSAETMPHNLLLFEEELDRQGPYAKVAPPLRSPAEAESLWQALLDGTVDMVATDHAPHLPQEKEAGRADIWRAPGGLPGLQTFLPLMLDQVAKGRWEWSDLVRGCAEAPARVFGLYPRKGAIELGSDADLVLVDPRRAAVIDNASQLSKARVTPFAGRVLTGSLMITMLRGQVIMRDGTVEGPPRGRLVTPVAVGPAAPISTSSL
jgi:dihydroorotase